MIKLLGDELRGTTVGGTNVVRVHTHRRRPAIAVAEPTRDRPKVDATGEELGGVEVAQVPQRVGDADQLRQLAVLMGEVVRMPRPTTCRIRCEHEGVQREHNVNRSQRRGAGVVEVTQQLDGQRVEGEPARVIGLRALDPADTLADDVVVVDEQLASLEVAAGPAKRSELAAPRAGRDSEPEVQAELGVSHPRLVDQLGDQSRFRGHRAPPGELGEVCVQGRVALDPTPGDRVAECG